jgi:hypothetical protein
MIIRKDGPWEEGVFWLHLYQRWRSHFVYDFNYYAQEREMLAGATPGAQKTEWIELLLWIVVLFKCEHENFTLTSPDTVQFGYHRGAHSPPGRWVELYHQGAHSPPGRWVGLLGALFGPGTISFSSGSTSWALWWGGGLGQLTTCLPRWRGSENHGTTQLAHQLLQIQGNAGFQATLQHPVLAIAAAVDEGRAVDGRGEVHE